MERVKTLLTELIGAELTGVVGNAYYWFIAPLIANPILRWSFLTFTILVAWLYYMLRVAKSGEQSIRSFLSFLFPKAIWGHPSAVLDYKYYVVTQFLMTNLRLGQFVLGLIAILHVSDGVTWLIGATVGPGAEDATPSWPAIVAFTILLTAAVDFAGFFSHYLHHRVPLLWEFHKIHHSADVLTPFSAFRAHPVDQAMEFLLRMIATAIVTGAFVYFYPTGIKELTVLNYSAITFFAHLTIHLRHSHVPIGYGAVSVLLVSPVMHQLHHSTSAQHLDRNFGLVFSVWDSLFGTRYVPRRDEQWQLGLLPASDRYGSVWNLYFHPFIAGARLLARPRQAFFRRNEG